MTWVESTKKPPVKKDVLAQKEGRYFVCHFDGEHWMIDSQIIEEPAAWKFIEEQYEKGQLVYAPVFNATCNPVKYDSLDKDGNHIVIGGDGNSAKAMSVYKTEPEAQQEMQKLSKLAEDFFRGGK